jgi:rfaE bifunctional protein kinase chain/domain
MLTPSRLSALLSRFPHTAIAVVGDFFLDKYLEIDPALAEVSLETGLEARQVVGVRCQPGAAGTVVGNLCALGVGRVVCIGFVGDDGEGFELVRGLRSMGAETNEVLVRPDRFTPTYCKPLVREPACGRRLRELERMDTKNRQPLPPDLEQALIGALRAVVPEVQAVIALDQVQEAECGVITRATREALAEVACTFPDKLFLGDSRTRVGEYRNVMVKANREEVCGAIHPGSAAHRSDGIGVCAGALSQRVGRPVFVTLGSEGVMYGTHDAAQIIPAVPVTGGVDIVGAGDAATAALASALSAGATPTEAAVIANIAASLTIQQIGTTGTATQEQVRERFEQYADVWRNLR